MLVQWCLKGIAKSPGFKDSEARAALSSNGISSAWVRAAVPGVPVSDLPSRSHGVLSQTALDAHVNAFGLTAAATPYLSLSAGCVELDPFSRSTRTFSALQTALEFATRSGTTDGYVFRLWVLVSPKPAPELPGFAEEVRELNLYKQYATFHYEGEVAAKLFIPARQIAYVERYDASLKRLWRLRNSDFVGPERVSNVLELL
jgi:hypothetical protein